MNARSLLIISLAAAPLLTACPRDKNSDELTAVEASQALEESSMDGSAQAVTADQVELSTHFTIGQAAEKAASELHTFIASQVPCALLTLDKNVLTVDYGQKGDNCLYHGKEISGESQLKITKSDVGDVVVEHTWIGLSNGIHQIDGHATVTWTKQTPSRHVVHQTTVKRLSDGVTIESEGDRVQTPLAGGTQEGFEVNGTRHWTSPRGDWALAIDAVQMRWVDPIAQAGTYTLTTPRNKELKFSFARQDADTIRVTIAGPKRSFTFDVNKLGKSSEVAP